MRLRTVCIALLAVGVAGTVVVAAAQFIPLTAKDRGGLTLVPKADTFRTSWRQPTAEGFLEIEATIVSNQKQAKGVLGALLSRAVFDSTPIAEQDTSLALDVTFEERIRGVFHAKPGCYENGVPTTCPAIPARFVRTITIPDAKPTPVDAETQK